MTRRPAHRTGSARAQRCRGSAHSARSIDSAGNPFAGRVRLVSTRVTSMPRPCCVYQTEMPCFSIHCRMSSARHTVTRSESFTGSGKVRAWTRRHRVDLTQEAGVGQLEIRRRRAGGRSRRGDGECVVHDRASSRRGPAKVMTCSVAAALGQVGASRWGTLNSTARRARPGVAAW